MATKKRHIVADWEGNIDRDSASPTAVFDDETVDTGANSGNNSQTGQYSDMWKDSGSSNSQSNYNSFKSSQDDNYFGNDSTPSASSAPSIWDRMNNFLNDSWLGKIGKNYDYSNNNEQDTTKAFTYNTPDYSNNLQTQKDDSYFGNDNNSGSIKNWLDNVGKNFNYGTNDNTSLNNYVQGYTGNNKAQTPDYNYTPTGGTGIDSKNIDTGIFTPISRAENDIMNSRPVQDFAHSDLGKWLGRVSYAAGQGADWNEGAANDVSNTSTGNGIADWLANLVGYGGALMANPTELMQFAPGSIGEKYLGNASGSIGEGLNKVIGQPTEKYISQPVRNLIANRLGKNSIDELSTPVYNALQYGLQANKTGLEWMGLTGAQDTINNANPNAQQKSYSDIAKDMLDSYLGGVLFGAASKGVKEEVMPRVSNIFERKSLNNQGFQEVSPDSGIWYKNNNNYQWVTDDPSGTVGHFESVSTTPTLYYEQTPYRGQMVPKWTVKLKQAMDNSKNPDEAYNTMQDFYKGTHQNLDNLLTSESPVNTQQERPITQTSTTEPNTVTSVQSVEPMKEEIKTTNANIPLESNVAQNVSNEVLHPNATEIQGNNTANTVNLRSYGNVQVLNDDGKTVTVQTSKGTKIPMPKKTFDVLSSANENSDVQPYNKLQKPTMTQTKNTQQYSDDFINKRLQTLTDTTKNLLAQNNGQVTPNIQNQLNTMSVEFNKLLQMKNERQNNNTVSKVQEIQPQREEIKVAQNPSNEVLNTSNAKVKSFEDAKQDLQGQTAINSDNIQPQEEVKQVSQATTPVKVITPQKSSNSNITHKVNDQVMFVHNNKLDAGTISKVNNDDTVEIQRPEGDYVIAQKKGATYRTIKSQPTAKEQIAIDDRTSANVGDKNIKSYQYLHPELKSYIQDDAKTILQDLKDTQRHNKYAVDKNGTTQAYSEPRIASDDIKYLRDQTKMSYADIEEGLNKLINDNGTENNAKSKKIELVIDNRLSNGYKDFKTGYNVEANKDYITKKNEIEGSGQKLNTEVKEEKPQEAKMNNWLDSVSKDDINYDKAYNAYRGMSFDPERRAKEEQTSYINHMKNIHEKMSKLAETPEQKAILETELNRYRENYLKHMNDILSARSRTLSPMITGPAKFPKARNEKALNAEHNKVVAFLDWQKKAEKSIEKKITGSMNEEQKGDAEFERLKKEALHTIGILKDAGSGGSYFKNLLKDKIMRSLNNGNIESVNKLMDFIKETENKYLKKPVFTQNNGIWKTIESANEKLKNSPEAKTGIENIKTYEGANIDKNFNTDRVQISFDEIPSEEIRKELKATGWRFSKANGDVWQRKLTSNAEIVAKRIMDKYYSESNQVKENTTTYNTKELDKFYSNKDEGGKELAGKAIESTRELEHRIRSTGGTTSGNGIKTLGLSFTKSLENKGYVDLKGREVKDHKDVAVMAQIFRSPQYETFRIFYVKGNEIVGHEAITSRIPGSTVTFLKGKGATILQMRDRMKRLGADGYYLLHNHPSGEPKPSRADIDVTKFYKDNIKGFKDHVIINSNKYTSITSGNMYDLNLGKDKLLNPSIDHPLLGEKINNAEKLAQVSKELQLDKKQSAVFYMDSQLKTRAIQEIPNKMLRDEKALTDYLRGRMKEFGSNSIFINANGDEYATTLANLIRKGYINDGLINTEEAIISLRKDMGIKSKAETGKWMGVKLNKGFRVTEDAAEYTDKDFLAAKRMAEYVLNPKNKLKNDPIKDFVNNLYNFKGKSEAENSVHFAVEVMLDKGSYKEQIQKAYDMTKAKYKNNLLALKALDNKFSGIVENNFADINSQPKFSKEISNHVNKNTTVKTNTADTKKPSGVKASFGTNTTTLNNNGIGKTLPRKQIIDNLIKELDIPTRVGRISIKKAQGIYKEKAEVIRTKLAEDIPTLSHEIGHHLDKLYNISNQVKNNSKFNKEILGLGEEQAKLQKLNAEDQRSEGIAEFIRKYLTGGDLSNISYTNIFEKMLDKKLLKSMQEFKKNYSDYLNADSGERMLSQVDFGNSRKSLKNKTSEKIKDIKDTTFDKFYTTWIDELRPLYNLTKNSKSTKITSDPFKMAWTFRGWSGKAIGAIKYGVYNYKDNKLVKVSESLNDVLKPIKANQMDDFRKYIIAKRVIEKEEQGIHTGFNLVDAQNVVSKLEKNPDFVKSHEGLQTYQDAILKRLVNSGLMSEEQYGKIKELNKDYVPFYRALDVEEGNGKYTGSTFGNIKSPVKKMKGGNSSIIDPIESIVKNTYYFTNLSERNLVGQSLVKFAEENEGMGKYIENVTPKMSVTKFDLKEIKKSLETANFDVDNADLEQVAAVFRPILRGNASENIITVSIDGKPKLYQLDPDIYKAVMGLDRESSNLIFRIANQATKTLRAGAVLNPEFALRNMTRDALDAFVYSKYHFIPVFDTLKGLAHVFKKDEAYNLWLNSGAAQSDFVSLDRDYLSKGVRSVLSKGKPLEILKSFLKEPLSPLRYLSSLSEEATRLGHFTKGLKKEGNTREGISEVGLSTRDLTLDFSRSGLAGKNANRIVAFFNATVQGQDKMLRTFKNPKTRYAALLKALVGVTLPSIALWCMYHDDDKIKELPLWRKDLFWNIPTENYVISIPKPFELGVIFGSLPERLMDSFYGSDPKAMEAWAQDFFENLLPGGIPTFVEPAIEWWANKSFFTGLPIESQSDLKSQPYERYSASTSLLAKNLGDATQSLIEGGLSPKKIDNTIRGYTAGLGQYGVSIIDKILGNNNEKPASGLKQIPGVKGFLNEPYSQARIVDDFYTAKDELKTKYDEALKKLKDENPNVTDSEWTSILKNDITPFKEKKVVSLPKDVSDLHKQQTVYDKVGDYLSDARKQEQAIYSDETLSAAVKQGKINELHFKTVQYLKEFNNNIDNGNVDTVLKKFKDEEDTKKKSKTTNSKTSSSSSFLNHN